MDKRQQETSEDVLIGDAIHVALKNTDVCRPLGRNSGPDMNLYVKHKLVNSVAAINKHKT